MCVCVCVLVVGATVSSWGWVTSERNEEEMCIFMYDRGPISACVDAEQWQHYSTGIFAGSSCGVSIDHCILVTGE